MIYFVQELVRGNVKIGYVSREAARRVQDLQVGSVAELRLLGTRPGDKQAETELHRRFADDRVRFADGRPRREWFRPSVGLMMLCTATASAAFDELAALEPRLWLLLARARALYRKAGGRFCANDAFFGRTSANWLSFDHQISKLVGWSRTDCPELATSKAYDVVCGMILDALPPCRRCGCRTEEDILPGITEWAGATNKKRRRSKGGDSCPE